ncbi:uncharacterized protein LOC119572589 [Penaeus monodon]|uniref:uncharacterized protein LOC119572589 n=1 Tax=Penaeus monodon TaxID=6687 RepID=UPI0018A79E76|nr:uncharacterized protein LOC119572589 [Penaeus monodon]
MREMRLTGYSAPFLFLQTAHLFLQVQHDVYALAIGNIYVRTEKNPAPWQWVSLCLLLGEKKELAIDGNLLDLATSEVIDLTVCTWLVWKPWPSAKNCLAGTIATSARGSGKSWPQTTGGLVPSILTGHTRTTWLTIPPEPRAFSKSRRSRRTSSVFLDHNTDFLLTSVLNHRGLTYAQALEYCQSYGGSLLSAAKRSDLEEAEQITNEGNISISFWIDDCTVWRKTDGQIVIFKKPCAATTREFMCKDVT